MLRAKLRAYIASTCLANAFLLGGVLQPLQARSIEPTEPRNPLPTEPGNSADKPPPISSPIQVPAQDILEQDSCAVNHLFQFDRNEVQTFEFSNDDIEPDLDSILDNEFEQRGILIARCCV